MNPKLNFVLEIKFALFSYMNYKGLLQNESHKWGVGGGDAKKKAFNFNYLD